MSNYSYLGSRPASGALDNTQRNAGNWTVTFTPDILSLGEGGTYEVQKITIRNGTPGAKFDVFIEIAHYTRSALDAFGENEWAPTTDGEFVIRPGEYVYFFFTDPQSSGNQPLIVLYLKQNMELRENQLQMRLGR